MFGKVTWILVAAYAVSLVATMLPQAVERVAGLSLAFFFLFLVQWRAYRWVGRMRAAACLDGLTGLHNFAYFEKALQREMAASVRTKQRLSLVMIDSGQVQAI